MRNSSLEHHQALTTLNFIHVEFITEMFSLLLGDQGIQVDYKSLYFIYLLISSQTAQCGWGAEAAESVKKGEFIIEYIGEGSFI